LHDDLLWGEIICRCRGSGLTVWSMEWGAEE
jgi:hypothetical protein